MSKPRIPASVSARAEIDAFLAEVRRRAPAAAGAARGRLVFALDATMSRQPTWDSACVLQAEMFREAAGIGGLEIQLVYFRGLSECRASGWISASAKLAELMGRIDCRGGHTQIGKVLAHVRQEHMRGGVRAAVFVGDSMEERLDDLCRTAGELGLLGVPVFVFQEGHDPVAAHAFREIARLSGGAHCRFDAGAAHELGALLRAVAAYAAGGRAALAALASRRMDAARKLLAQLS
ncbi:MAG: VWA domain-containing protein [Pseudolabrys sp.]|nr:VWA domain-containing protein [Pseudolabrys sp.]